MRKIATPSAEGIINGSVFRSIARSSHSTLCVRVRTIKGYIVSNQIIILVICVNQHKLGLAAMLERYTFFSMITWPDTISHIL